MVREQARGRFGTFAGSTKIDPGICFKKLASVSAGARRAARALRAAA